MIDNVYFIYEIDGIASLRYFHVTLTFGVWTRVMVTTHRLNDDNNCTKLYGNPSMHT